MKVRVAHSIFLALLYLVLATPVFAAQEDNQMLVFTASARCPACAKQSPSFNKDLAEDYPIQIIDVDRFPLYAKNYKIRAVPSFVIVNQAGVVIERNEGFEAREFKESVVRFLKKRIEPSLMPLEIKQDENPSRIIVSPITSPFARFPYIARIRTKDEIGIGFGTGSVIQSDGEKALILTAAHLFRKMTNRSLIEIDLFNSNTGKVETFVGKIVQLDLDGDVGLISIPAKRIISTLPIASPEDAVKIDQHVFSYGCGGGEPPSFLKSRVTALNKYTGPANIECTGVPIGGRSGGALVNKDNEIVGVTLAADMDGGRGVYAGLSVIYKLLVNRNVMDSPILPSSVPNIKPQQSLNSISNAPPIVTIRPSQNPIGQRTIIINRQTPTANPFYR